MFTEEFFPTPPAITVKMRARISKDAQYFLEPNAGKGDLAEAIRGERGYDRKKVDCIEISPELCAILQDKDFPVVGTDWLEYDGVCYYDAIVMNPPFSNGDAHLLKAWDFLHDGEIVCLLNEETIKNPHTKNRKRLAAIIEQHGEVEYLGDCFSTAERKTGVRVAMVYLKKEAEDDRLDLWANESQERDIADDIQAGNIPAVMDSLGNMQHYYDAANIHMFKAFQHIRKAAIYMEANGHKYLKSDYDNILPLALENINATKAEFSKIHRNKSWHKVFSRMEFHKWLDQKQRNELIRDIDRNGNIPFTKENIKGTLQNIFEQRQRLFEQSVANVFDELTRYYKDNANHTEGWKTNDNYKINKKIIFPWGCRFDKDFRKFTTSYGSSMMDIYNDLDRVLCVMTGRNFEHCETIGEALRRKFDILGYDVKSPYDNETESRFFFIKFYMKGTVHLTFKDNADWELFNKTAAKGRALLGQDTQSEAA